MWRILSLLILIPIGVWAQDQSEPLDVVACPAKAWTVSDPASSSLG